MICARGEKGLPQVGLVASRRVGGAVTRNRAKRRLREALLRVELRGDTAYVVVASPDVATMGFDRLIHGLGDAIAESERDEESR